MKLFNGFCTKDDVACYVAHRLNISIAVIPVAERAHQSILHNKFNSIKNSIREMTNGSSLLFHTVDNLLLLEVDGFVPYVSDRCYEYLYSLPIESHDNCKYLTHA